MIEKTREILKGIDKDICQDKDGWWETSTGAEFGAKKLKEIEDLLKNCSIPDVSQQRELLIAFAKYMEENKMYARHDEAYVDDFLKNKTMNYV